VGVETEARTPRVWAISRCASRVQTIFEICDGVRPAGSGRWVRCAKAAGDATPAAHPMSMRPTLRPATARWSACRRCRDEPAPTAGAVTVVAGPTAAVPCAPADLKARVRSGCVSRSRGRYQLLHEEGGRPVRKGRHESTPEPFGCGNMISAVDCAIAVYGAVRAGGYGPARLEDEVRRPQYPSRSSISSRFCQCRSTFTWRSR